MKRIFIFLLLLSSIQAYTQIKTGGSLELGYENRGLRVFDYNTNTTYQSLWLKDKLFADIHLNVNYKGLSVYTKVKTYFKYETFYRYDPFQVEYKVGINYQIKNFLFDAEHMCSNSIESESLYEAYDKISVKIDLWSQQDYTQIKTTGTLELGYENRILRIFDDTINAGYQSYWLKDKLFADVSLSAYYKGLSIYTSVKTYFNYETFYRYDPLQVGYKIGISYGLGKNKVFLFSAEHMCFHSIGFDSFYEVYDRFSVRINLGNKK